MSIARISDTKVRCLRLGHTMPDSTQTAPRWMPVPGKDDELGPPRATAVKRTSQRDTVLGHAVSTAMPPSRKLQAHASTFLACSRETERASLKLGMVSRIRRS
jgi:hypothetical protein